MRNDYSSDYLMHHGILGMKWGIRRYQNPDGSLTELGKKRVEKAQNRANKAAEKIAKRKAKYDEQNRKIAEEFNKKYKAKAEKTAQKLIDKGSKLNDRNIKRLQKKYDLQMKEADRWDVTKRGQDTINEMMRQNQQHYTQLHIQEVQRNMYQQQQFMNQVSYHQMMHATHMF